MDKYESLSHTKWSASRCIYSEVSSQALYEQLRQHLGEVFHGLARQKQSCVE